MTIIDVSPIAFYVMYQANEHPIIMQTFGDKTRYEEHPIFYGKLSQNPAPFIVKFFTLHHEKLNKRKLPCRITTRSRKDILKELKKQLGLCLYCGNLGNSIDHFFPTNKWPQIGKAKSSANQMENLTLACQSCNSSKNNKIPSLYDWMKHQTLKRNALVR